MTTAAPTPAPVTTTDIDKTDRPSITLEPAHRGAWTLARIIANSDLAPKGLKGKTSDIFILLVHAIELNMPPMTALQGMAVINGRPSMFGDLLLAKIVNDPKCSGFEEYFVNPKGERTTFLTPEDLNHDLTMAVCVFERVGAKQAIARTFSIAQAKRANLWKKAGPWVEYPDRMLQMRARGRAGRDAFPDVLKGIVMAEEARDMPPVEHTPVADPAREIRRVSETRLRDFTDKSGDTRPTEVIDAAGTPDPQVTVGPLTVKAVEPFLGLHTITLADGTKVDTTEPNDAMVLETAMNSGHAFNFLCTRTSDGNLHLVSFVIAE